VAKEESVETPSEKALLEALTQNWLHCRHLENERLNFTSVYSVIVAGVLAVLGQVNFKGYTYLLFFLLVLSILGLLFSSKIDLEFNNHMQKINTIVNELNLWGYMGVPTSFSSKLLRPIRSRHIFSAFYFLSIILWSYLLIK
jgi:hypothetical protein